MHFDSTSKIKFCLSGWVGLIFLMGCTPVSETNAEPQKVVPIAATGNCPQVRKTPSAPKAMRDRVNPVSVSEDSLKAGQRLYRNSKPLSCNLCHGDQGDGMGDPDFESTPQARNFTCASTMNDLSDGQLFWIIKNGSPNTSMPAFTDLSEEDAWKLVHYLRGFSKSK